MKYANIIVTSAVSTVLASSAFAQLQGPSTGSTPYVLPSGPNAAFMQTHSILTVDNTGANPDDIVPKIGGGTYSLNGLPDGLGAFASNSNEFTVLMSHEMGNTVGITRDHGNKGSYVSKFTINKNTLAVTGGEDLIKQVYGWNTALQQSDTAISTPAFNRFCSADLPAVSAFFNAGTGKGSTERIFMHGEESGSFGWQQATVVTGSDAGKSYTLGKFNLTTNGSGLTGVGGWENALANPLPQDKTVVIGNNDGGTGIMNNALAVYVGNKQNTGSEIDKAGLTNGTLSFINVVGNTAEIVNGTTRATNITNGTRFNLSNTASTVFSRPEDGAWNPLNPSQFFFVTTDRIDQVSDGTGAQIGQTRLWKLTFDDITNPSLGGAVDLMIDGDIVDGKKVNMFDNMAFTADGKIILQEDVGGSAHNGKMFLYDPITDAIMKIAAHDTARFGDLTLAATAPYTNDEEASGVIDITALMAGSLLNTGLPGEQWLLSSDQAHYTSGITAAQVEGGQLFAIHVLPEPTTLGFMGLGAAALIRRRRA